MTDLGAAVVAILQRKLAVAGGVESFDADRDHLALLFSGFEIDTAGLSEVATVVAAESNVELRGTLTEILAGVWLDGVLLGLFHAAQTDREHGAVES